MNKSVQLLGLFIFLWIISGCASTVQYVPLPDQSKSVEDPNKARIYLLRPTIIGGAFAFSISDGQTPIGFTGPTAFLSWERDPGKTTLTIFRESKIIYELPITVEKGKRYYIEQFVYCGAQSTLIILQEDFGKRKLNECNPPQIRQ